MRANAVLWWILAAFFVVVDVAYLVWNLVSYGAVEWSGTVALSLATIASVFLAFYLTRAHSAEHGELPEDRLDGEIDEGDPEMGFYSPWSWWPIMLAFSAGLLMLGLAVGFWICFIGAALLLVSVVGWVFEYYRGYFAR
ncbi:cytochrome c oxidase subunit 4 [Herbiconiux ginsengi]|uniref:Cytochrome c oxidase polypeptide 4 n=1 Tax=Herbiconiux ginsengi TaxID=381665 RepID=A0A1H3KTT2_9MICO|nr:cytochrome c oxidase subunit 4 [Herbiconiux ginsengi]SDY55593.1 Cytochrome c oxidase subunit IV [Herbiconiux ginsengi]